MPDLLPSNNGVSLSSSLAESTFCLAEGDLLYICNSCLPKTSPGITMSGGLNCSVTMLWILRDYRYCKVLHTLGQCI